MSYQFSIICFISFLISIPASFIVAADTDDTKIKALIVDGQNNHAWQETTPLLKKILTDSGRFSVSVATSPTDEEKKNNPAQYLQDMKTFKPDFANFDVVVLNYYGDDWSREAETALEEYVQNGGGLVTYHAAACCFPRWKAFNEMRAVGGWMGRDEKWGPFIYWENGEIVRNNEPGPAGHHGPQWAYLLEVRNTTHPITRGLPLAFRHAEDELYDKMRGPAINTEVLVTAYADPDYQGSGRHVPILMAVDYGKGRVFNTFLGHAAKQCQSVSFIVTFLRGTEWAATGKVTIPIPNDMPGGEKPVFRKY